LYSHKADLEQLPSSNSRPFPRRGAPPPAAVRGADCYFELKSELHRKLIGVVNLERVSRGLSQRVPAVTIS
jgi:hypothetical protein